MRNVEDYRQFMRGQENRINALFRRLAALQPGLDGLARNIFDSWCTDWLQHLPRDHPEMFGALATVLTVFCPTTPRAERKERLMSLTKTWGNTHFPHLKTLVFRTGLFLETIENAEAQEAFGWLCCLMHPGSTSLADSYLMGLQNEDAPRDASKKTQGVPA